MLVFDKLKNEKKKKKNYDSAIWMVIVKVIRKCEYGA
jgi:hypothetical protein